MSGTVEILPVAWYISRATGITAFILLTIVVANGLLMSTRLTARFMPTALNYEMHRFFAWNAILFVMIHFFSLLFDPYFHLLPSEAFVPFLLSREALSALGFNFRWTVALGILAFYGMLVLVLTTEWRRKIPYKIWRGLHYASFPTYFLFLIHGITSGTDSREWWMLWLYSLSFLIVGSLIVVRIRLSLQKQTLS